MKKTIVIIAYIGLILIFGQCMKPSNKSGKDLLNDIINKSIINGNFDSKLFYSFISELDKSEFKVLCSEYKKIYDKLNNREIMLGGIIYFGCYDEDNDCKEAFINLVYIKSRENYIEIVKNPDKVSEYLNFTDPKIAFPLIKANLIKVGKDRFDLDIQEEFSMPVRYGKISDDDFSNTYPIFYSNYQNNKQVMDCGEFKSTLKLNLPPR